MTCGLCKKIKPCGCDVKLAHLNHIDEGVIEPWCEYCACKECGHPETDHYEDSDGYLGCDGGSYKGPDGWMIHPCNCGWNIGR